jgi:RHS repeat-associated protein
VGNRLTRTSTVAGVPAQTFSFDANDRLATDTYDSNGNTLTSGLATYTYDFADRLLTGPGVTNVYDGDGNRVARTAGGVNTRFLIDDLTPTGYAQVAEEVVSGAVTRRYTHGPMRISQSQLISGNWTTHYYGYDAGGTVRQLTNGSGAVTDTYDYDAYGLLIAQTGSTPNLYLYRGEQWDPSLELYYLRARWMQPRTGRFVTADKWEGEPSRPTTLNRFSYANGDGANEIDPSGYGSRIFSWAAVGGFFGPLYQQTSALGQNVRGLLSLGTYSQRFADLTESSLVFVQQRADFLQESMQYFGPQGTGRITAAVAQVIHPVTRQVLSVVSTSGRHLTGAFVDEVLAPFEVPIYGASVHAEINILTWAQQNGYYIISIAAGRGICVPCQIAIAEVSSSQPFQIFVGTAYRGYQWRGGKVRSERLKRSRERA